MQSSNWRARVVGVWGTWRRSWGESRPIVVTLTVLVALLVVGVPSALGATTWYEIGSAASPINHDALSDASNPLLALVGAAPYLTWNEADTFSGTTTGQVRVSSLTGLPVDSRPWTELANPSSDPNAPGSLNLDPTHPARDIHVTDIAGVPYAAWIENDGTADQIHVARWNGTRWVVVGAAVNSGTSGDNTPSEVSIIGFNGTPYVAWTRGQYRFLDVKRFDGSSWVDAGTGLNFYPGALAYDPQFATDGSTLYIAWAEDCSPNETKVWLSKYAGGTSTTWTRYTDSASGCNAGVLSPSLAILHARPFVAFAEPDTTSGPTRVFVKAPADPANANDNWNDVPYRDTGSSAVPPTNSDGAMSRPSLAVVGGSTPALYVTWAEVSPSTAPGTQHLIYVDKFTTSGGGLPPTTGLVDGGWDPVGTTPLNHDDTKDAVTPAIIDRGGGVPLVAWTEIDGAGHAQVRTASFGEVPQSTGRPQISGTPKTGSQLTCTHAPGMTRRRATPFCGIGGCAPQRPTPTRPGTRSAAPPEPPTPYRATTRVHACAAG